VNATCCGHEHCQTDVSIPFQHGGTHSTWCQIAGSMSTCTSGFARCLLWLPLIFVWNSTDSLRSGTQIMKSALLRWTQRGTSSHPSQCKARRARRSGRTLSSIQTPASFATFAARCRCASKGERNRGVSMRGLSRDITPRLKSVHDPRRCSGCARSRPGFGRARIPDSETMPKRQAADGEVTEGVMATYEHGEQAAARVAADLREGIQEMVAVNLMPSTVWSLRFTGHGFPKSITSSFCAQRPSFGPLVRVNSGICSRTRPLARPLKRETGTFRQLRQRGRSRGLAGRQASWLLSSTSA
jgi:hypothetical protein